MPRLTIRQKSLLLFMSISIVPLMAINLFWLHSDQASLRTAAADKQSLLANSAATSVDEYLTDTINSLIIHAQTSSVQKFDIPYADQELGAFMNQDVDVQRIALVDASGQERTAFDRHGLLTQLNNVATSDPFRVVTFLSGKEYVTPVFYDQQVPHVIIAVPIVTLENSQDISNLSTAESGVIRGPNDIHGALIADISLKDLWQSVLSTKLGATGYAYLVDDKGFLIAYPNQDFIKSNSNQSHTPEVAAFLASNGAARGQSEQTLSEKKVAVLSTYSRVERTGWAVIAEEPLDSIYSTVRHLSTVAIVIFWISGMLAIILSLLFSHQLSTPILKLTEGARRIGSGDLTYRFNFKSKDEMGILARTFNDMADNLLQVVRGVEAGRNKLDVVLNSIGEGVLAVDGRRTILVSNDAAANLIGTLPQDVIGKNLDAIFKWTKNDRPVDINYAQPTALYSQLRLLAPNGQTHYLDLTVARITDDPTGIQSIITIHDETKNRELEAMKVDFVSMAAHELRTPLTAIRGYLGLLKDEGESQLSPTQRQYLDRTQVSSNQLAGLINNLLNVSRIERGALNMHLDKLNWTELVRNIVKDQTFAARQKGISISYNGPDSDLWIIGDEVALSEVVNNLISNAIHYSPNGSTIVAGVQYRQNDILTSVADNGIGISPEAQAHLFTKFFRVHGGLAMGSGGTGLGLYISKSIVEMHQGKIWVESEVHKGSNFCFSLPHFDQKRYDEISSKSLNLKKRHGWITKNITR